MHRRLLPLAALACAACAGVALTGVNIASAEFQEGLCPGVDTVDYEWPKESEYAYWKAKGATLIRMPFLWCRLQPTSGGAFDTTYFNNLKAAIAGITNKGMAAIVDPHNYARYPGKWGKVIGEPGSPVTAAHFADLWTRLANAFKDNPLAVFEVMNEPHTMKGSLWFADAQVAIDAIRATGATNLILVPGNAWTGGHSWEQNWYDGDGQTNAQRWVGLKDPKNNMMVDIHQYLDDGYSGTSRGCKSATIGSEVLAGFTAWAKKTGNKAMLTEFGASTDSPCAAATENLLKYMDDNSDVWAGWTWWSAGPRWGEYMFTTEPQGTTDRPQTAWLVKHFSTINAKAYLQARAGGDPTPPPATEESSSAKTPVVVASSSSAHPPAPPGVPSSSAPYVPPAGLSSSAPYVPPTPPGTSGSNPVQEMSLASAASSLAVLLPLALAPLAAL